ncbi:hypothetical protein [Algoriphagus persicinus]|uniref:hypothetical protein n=1 Tax=Algoriphagus persicinus TaxID=3108754 RepID=UPI002B3990E5|nr:hypothetical protein [Algoriphagus sp. E1-3-M2]MEB2784485.1 hypothetical protein [Algoriphagus sp. E1-3-M2]
MKRLSFGLIFLFFLGPLSAQTSGKLTDQDTTTIQALDTVSQDIITVFLDCEVCDNNFIRQQINFVNYVRDPMLGQLHLFITRQGTAGGGRVFTLSFIGKQRFLDINNTLTYTSVQTNTQDEEREGLNSMITLGLVPYVAHTSMADKFLVSISDIDIEQRPEEDKWKNWIFEIYGGIDFSKETSVSALDLRYGFSAEHITEQWRIRLRPYFNYNKRDFARNGEVIESILHRNGFYGRAVRSISSHWSVGLFTNVISSTFSNIDLGISAAPAIEYSIFPYTEALRKEITIAYSAGFDRRTYMEETIFGKLEESLPSHALEFGVRIRQPWGSLRIELEGSQFLHDLSKYRISFDSNLAWRIYKGLSVNLSSELGIVRDQLSLPKGDVSLEDILLQQRQLATSFGVSMSVGISYSFGSIYNSIVNTRL